MGCHSFGFDQMEIVYLFTYLIYDQFFTVIIYMSLDGAPILLPSAVVTSIRYPEYVSCIYKHRLTTSMC